MGIGWRTVDMRILGIVTLCASLSALATPASASCYEPSAPYCATRYGAFSDEDEFHRCKREMESYKTEANDFLACTKREADDVIQQYNSAVESFNRRARD
jgi:hypothetical protein